MWLFLKCGPSREWHAGVVVLLVFAAFWTESSPSPSGKRRAAGEPIAFSKRDGGGNHKFRECKLRHKKLARLRFGPWASPWLRSQGDFLLRVGVPWALAAYDSGPCRLDSFPMKKRKAYITTQSVYNSHINAALAAANNLNNYKKEEVELKPPSPKEVDPDLFRGLGTFLHKKI